MIIRALLPKLAPKTVKEKIILILTSEYPLTVKELKQKIKNNFNESVSYQSVHKELNHLVSDQILIQENKKYLLNVDWIRQVGLFSDLIISNYTSQKKHSINKLLELKNDGDSLSFDFDSFADLDNYFLELLDYFNEFFESDKKILMHYHYNWWPLIYPVREKNIASKLKSKFYGVCNSTSKLDQYCMKFERDIGFKIFLSNNPSIAWNTNVMGDLVVYFYVDNTIYSEVEHFFEKNKDSTMVNMNELITLIQKKGKFRVLIVKESSLAKNILEEIKLFREK
jgi:hypothetical protein